MRIIIAHLALHCVAALRVFPRGTLRLVDSPRLTLDAVDAAAEAASPARSMCMHT